MSGRIAGRFTELRRLGQGGMGSVSLALDHATGAACALKRVHVGDDARAAARLQAEFAALSRVRHPALVEVRDLVFERGGSPILVMEFVPGLHADQVLATGDVGAIVRMALRACEALAALHDAGVVHGDLKPANLLVPPETPGDVRLVDLGLAAVAGHERPAFAGTPGYAAPELRRGAPASVASDLFALGATLHALLTGALPRASHSSGLAGEAGDSPSDARALEQAGAPATLVSLILQLMASAPAERPADARAVARELVRLAPGARTTLAAQLETVRVVGREREIARVLAVHRRSAAAPGRVLLLGESGMGKSALLEEVAMRLRVEGVAVAMLPPEGPALHALAVTLSAAAGAEPPAAPALAAWLDDPAQPVAAEETDALLRWLAGCCAVLADRGRPAAILVDDLQRHDPATRAALRRLALMRECRALHLWASERADAPTRRLVQAGETVRLTLRPLRPAARRRLVDARLGSPSPAGLADDLDRHAEGHPGRMLTRLRAIAGAGAIHEREGRWVVAGEALAALAPAPAEADDLESRWAGIPGAATVMLALALSPRALSGDTLARIAPEAGGAALAAMVGAHLLRSAGGRYRPASPALAEAWSRSRGSAEIESMRRLLLTKAELTLSERFRLLVALGEDRAALELADVIADAGDGASIATAAAAAASRAADPRAGVWHLRAAREARRTGRYAVAARAYRAAAAGLRGDDRFEATEGELVARGRIGQHEHVLEACEQALREEPPPLWRAPLLLLRSSLESADGRAEQALRTIAEAKAAAAASGEVETRAQAGMLEAQTLLYQGRTDEALAAAEAVSRDAGASRGPALLRAEGVAGQALCRLGRAAEGMERMQRARRHARERGEEFARLELLQLEAGARMEAGEWAVTQRLHEQALHLALALDLPRSVAVSAANRLVTAALTGDLSRFRPRHRRALRLARRWSEQAHLDLAGRIAALAELARGRPAHARARLERSLSDPRVRADAASRRWSHLALAQAEDESGAADKAVALLDELLAEPGAGLVGALALARRGLLHAREGRADPAATDLAGLERLAIGAWGNALAHAAALRAATALAAGDAAATEEATAEMVRRFESLPAPHELAVALLGLTEVALLHGRAEAPVPAWLDQARERAERLRDARTQIRALELGERWLRMTGPVQPVPEDMTWLAEVGVLVQHIPHLPSFAQRAMAIVCHRLESERGVLLLASRLRPTAGSAESGPFDVVATFGEVDEDARRQALGFSRQVVQQVLRSGRGVRNSDVTRDPQMVSQSLMDMRVRSVLCEPLVVNGRAIGAVYLQDRWRSSEFGDQDSRRLQAFAQIMAAAIDLNWKQAANQEEHDRLVAEHVSLKRSTGSRFESGLLVGSHESMQRVNEMVERVAHRDSMVLITGESGTGKELVARSLHAKSLRRDGPFISINCGALPQSLIASELFGIAARSATDVDARPGLFQRADGGTLFMDEIAEMPMEQQVTLLRVLQTREVTPVGGERPVPVDVRVITATNQDLPRLVEEGRFRNDLFFRLHVVPIHLPPLRERMSDLPMLARHLATQLAARFDRPVPRMSARFLDALMAHDWPGNVRELEHYLERVMLLGSGDVLEPDPPPRAQPAARPASATGVAAGPLEEQLEAVRRERIVAALEACSGNQSRAARMLGVGEQKLRFWMRKLDIRMARNI